MVVPPKRPGSVCPELAKMAAHSLAGAARSRSRMVGSKKGSKWTSLKATTFRSGAGAGAGLVHPTASRAMAAASVRRVMGRF